jgi:UDP-glucose 4-epimerase
MQRRFLVTGGCGFIGSHLCDALIQAGHSVRILDDLSTGKATQVAAGAELITGDVGCQDTVLSAMDSMDGCFHLAAIASVARSVEAWQETHRTNLGGTINVLDAARYSGEATGKPVVYASSAAVYGDNTSLPLTEAEPIRPLTPYGADKAGSELHARAAWASFRVPNVGLRFFNIYGPRQDPKSPYSGVISIFCEKILQSAPVTIFGDGEQTRDFVYVGDVVRTLIRAMSRATEGSLLSNVCTGQMVSLLDLVGTLQKISAREAQIVFEAARTGDIRHSLGSPDNLSRELDIVASTSLLEGLSNLLEWHQDPKLAA